jgi:hypothetical protein
MELYLLTNRNSGRGFEHRCSRHRAQFEVQPIYQRSETNGKMNDPRKTFPVPQAWA